MKETKIKLETAKLAAEKGFYIHCKDFYCDYGLCHISDGEFLVTDNGVFYDCNGEFEHGDSYLAPTQSLLQRWLRDVHNIHINIGSFHCLGKEKPFGLEIDYKENDIWTYAEYDGETDFKTYEEALEIGLQESLKLIKTQKDGIHE